MNTHHSVAYDLELFGKVRRSLTISAQKDKGDHTLKYSRHVQYLYFSV